MLAHYHYLFQIWPTQSLCLMRICFHYYVFIRKTLKWLGLFVCEWYVYLSVIWLSPRIMFQAGFCVHIYFFVLPWTFPLFDETSTIFPKSIRSSTKEKHPLLFLFTTNEACWIFRYHCRESKKWLIWREILWISLW